MIGLATDCCSRVAIWAASGDRSSWYDALWHVVLFSCLQYPNAAGNGLDEPNNVDARSSGGWQHLILQQQQHELESLRQRAREPDKQVLADVWQQQHLYDDHGRLAGAVGYDGQGLPVPAPTDEEEAHQEAAGDTIMVCPQQKQSITCMRSE